MADQLSEEERMLAEAARTYAQEKLQPRVVAAYREETTDPSIFREMGEMGLLGVTIPEEYGGFGADHLGFCMAVETMSKYCIGVSVSYAANALCADPIIIGGSDEQKTALT